MAFYKPNLIEESSFDTYDLEPINKSQKKAHTVSLDGKNRAAILYVQHKGRYGKCYCPDCNVELDDHITGNLDTIISSLGLDQKKYLHLEDIGANISQKKKNGLADVKKASEVSIFYLFFDLYFFRFLYF